MWTLTRCALYFCLTVSRNVSALQTLETGAGCHNDFLFCRQIEPVEFLARVHLVVRTARCASGRFWRRICCFWRRGGRRRAAATFAIPFPVLAPGCAETLAIDLLN